MNIGGFYIGDNLDSDNELEVGLERFEVQVYLDLDSVKEIRDHLTNVLEESE